MSTSSAVIVRRAVGPDAVTMGAWAFVAGAGGEAMLQREGRRVELTYASSVLKDLLAAIGQIQADFHRLSGASPDTSAVTGDDWKGNAVRV
ncbi:hypothetical protein [Streptomyces sp. NPDC014894]|uniref:hypothetical protein n=1 Tax=unclassified Streptomyces TaxID=2593676 RepID=UPI003700EA3B